MGNDQQYTVFVSLLINELIDLKHQYGPLDWMHAHILKSLLFYLVKEMLK